MISKPTKKLRKILGIQPTNGTSLTWGDNEQLHSSLGHFQIVRLELIRNGSKILSQVPGPSGTYPDLSWARKRELGDDLYSLNNCKCCPKVGFNSKGEVYVHDRRGDWCFITDSIMKYFRLATYYGASIGWQLIYSPLGLSEKTKGIS